MENWPLVDGRCVSAGIEIVELPIDRLLNLCYSMIFEGAMFAEKDEIEKLHRQLDWPEDESASAESQDHSARRAVAMMGGDVDRMFAEAAAERAAALAARERRPALVSGDAG